MLITCKCLNISINTKGENVENAEKGSIALSPEEQKDPFFNKDFVKVDLVSISKEQSSLVQPRSVGNWVVHCCLNCGMDTHAVHRDRGAACVLISHKMLTDEAAISALKESAYYSQVFRVVVNSNVDSSVSGINFPDLHVPSSMQASLAALQQQLMEALQLKAQQVEECIRQFSEQQYIQLEEFRKRGHEEHQALARLLMQPKEDTSRFSLTQAPLPALGTKSSPTLPSPSELLKQAQSLPAPPVLQAPLPVRGSALASQLNTSPTSVGAQLGPTVHMAGSNSRVEDSVDSEGLFQLEGMDENPPEVFQSEESDSDESGSHDEGIHIPRGRGAPMNLARSLPVSVPNFSGEQCHVEDKEDESETHDPMDIAASIKALARSVHGDTVFGDLPRPRFSSQI